MIQAECGLMSITGFPDGAPTRSGIAVTDFLSGLYANQGILLALLDRVRTGTGQHIDIALFDSMLSTLTMPVGIFEATGLDPQRLGNAHASIAPYEVFQAQDGLIMICAGNDRLWRSLCEVIGRDDLAADPRFRTNADRVRERHLLKQTAGSRICLADRRGPGGPPGTAVGSRAAAFDRWPRRWPIRKLPRGTCCCISTCRGTVISACSATQSRCPASARRHQSVPPRLGQHTSAVLQSLGYTDE